MKNEGERIQKVLADAGVASRRKIEEMVSQGRISVNGHKAVTGMKLNPRRDVVTIDGVRVDLRAKKKMWYLALNKPRGYVTTSEDEMGRRCVVELVEDIPERVYPVGRLDKNSEGLLFLTNDGEFANMIMHPSNHVTKTYRVTVRPDISDEQAVRLSEGVVLDDGVKTAPASVVVLDKQPNRVVLQISIHEGRNRQIRRMCEAVGLTVARLKRIAVGPIKLGMLQPGEWRELAPSELIALRNAAGRAARPGASGISGMTSQPAGAPKNGSPKGGFGRDGGAPSQGRAGGKPSSLGRPEGTRRSPEGPRGNGKGSGPSYAGGYRQDKAPQGGRQDGRQDRRPKDDRGYDRAGGRPSGNHAGKGPSSGRSYQRDDRPDYRSGHSGNGSSGYANGGKGRYGDSRNPAKSGRPDNSGGYKGGYSSGGRQEGRSQSYGRPDASRGKDGGRSGGRPSYGRDGSSKGSAQGRNRGR